MTFTLCPDEGLGKSPGRGSTGVHGGRCRPWGCDSLPPLPHWLRDFVSSVVWGRGQFLAGKGFLGLPRQGTVPHPHPSLSPGTQHGGLRGSPGPSRVTDIRASLSVVTAHAAASPTWHRPSSQKGPRREGPQRAQIRLLFRALAYFPAVGTHPRVLPWGSLTRPAPCVWPAGPARPGLRSRGAEQGLPGG